MPLQRTRSRRRRPQRAEAKLVVLSHIRKWMSYANPTHLTRHRLQSEPPKLFVGVRDRMATLQSVMEDVSADLPSRTQAMRICARQELRVCRLWRAALGLATDLSPAEYYESLVEFLKDLNYALHIHRFSIFSMYHSDYAGLDPWSLFMRPRFLLERLHDHIQALTTGPVRISNSTKVASQGLFGKVVVDGLLASCNEALFCRRRQDQMAILALRAYTCFVERRHMCRLSEDGSEEELLTGEVFMSDEQLSDDEAMDLPQSFSEATAQFVASLTGGLPSYFLGLLRLPIRGKVQEQRDRLRAALTHSPDHSVITMVRAVCPDVEYSVTRNADEPSLADILASMAAEEAQEQDEPVLADILDSLAAEDWVR